MKLIINGDERTVDDGSTIESLLVAKGLRPQMVVVEHNGEIVPRPSYTTTVLSQGDTLEIVQMMAGG
jgi:sulfur carrier protein